MRGHSATEKLRSSETGCPVSTQTRWSENQKGFVMLSTAIKWLLRSGLACFWLLAPFVAAAQSNSPEELARALAQAFTAGDLQRFERLCPDPDAVELLEYAIKQKLSRRSGSARVIWRSGRRAILLLSGYPLTGNSGDDTIYARDLSGFYEAIRNANRWNVTRRIPIDEDNRILSQDLDVEVEPGQGLKVRDVLMLRVRSQYGFAACLNHRARLSQVRLNGRRVDSEFNGGLLWIAIKPAERARLELSYSLSVESDPGQSANSGMFHRDAGHVRNQYFWHPFFDFSSANDRATFQIRASIPAAYHLVTSVPATESISEAKHADARRIVKGRSASPTFALTLMYDRDWQTREIVAGKMKLALFTTADCKPSKEEIEQEFLRSYKLLSEAFGAPQGDWLSVAQGRARRGVGWHFRSNDLIVAGVQGGALTRDAGEPRAYFGHEVAHGWTAATGEAANFLGEGWATFSEAMLLADKYGAQVEARFWESQQSQYEKGGFDGRDSLLNDPNNRGVAYSKGAWVLRSLQHVMGAEAFRRGMRMYMQIPRGRPAGYAEFVRALSTASGHEMKSFLDPWCLGKSIPVLQARVEGRQLIVTQANDIFRFPLEVELISARGALRRTIGIREKENRLIVGDVGEITEIRIDPDRQYLLKR